jgi:hypothetical protein
MIAEFRDYLKTLNVAENYYIGKIENSKEYTLGIYADLSTRRVEAIGNEGSYGTFGVRLLLHWNKNARETEESAFDLFDKIRYITDIDMASGDSIIHVQYLDLDYDEPISMGTDENGVYEYVITGTIYYSKVPPEGKRMRSNDGKYLLAR